MSTSRSLAIVAFATGFGLAAAAVLTLCRPHPPADRTPADVFAVVSLGMAGLAMVVCNFKEVWKYVTGR